MPATMMTKASPMATTAMIVEEKSRFSMLILLKNTGLAKPNNMLPITRTYDKAEVLKDLDHGPVAGAELAEESRLRSGCLLRVGIHCIYAV